MSLRELNRRILIVDDNAAIHDDFRRILVPTSQSSALDEDAAALFGVSSAVQPQQPSFSLECVLQGQAALAAVTAGIAAERPFALAFVDMRMPPGWDGLTTIQKLWQIDPTLHVVICTAHSDRTWEEIETTLTARDQWAVLKKPFDKIEVLQFAHILTSKWSMAHRVTAAG